MTWPTRASRPLSSEKSHRELGHHSHHFEFTPASIVCKLQQPTLHYTALSVLISTPNTNFQDERAELVSLEDYVQLERQVELSLSAHGYSKPWHSIERHDIFNISSRSRPLNECVYASLLGNRPLDGLALIRYPSSAGWRLISSLSCDESS